MKLTDTNIKKAKPTLTFQRQFHCEKKKYCRSLHFLRWEDCDNKMSLAQ